MPRSKKTVFEMREHFEECGHFLSLLIDLCTSDVTLTQRSKLALTECSKSKMDIFEHAEGMLRDYDADTAPS